MIQWVEARQIPEKAETRGKSREVLVARSMFDPEVFKMRERVLLFTNQNQTGDVWWISLLESMVSEVCCLCHQNDAGGHRGVEGTLNKLLKGFIALSTRQNIWFLNGGCDTCLTKERSIPLQTREHIPFLTVYMGEKLFIDLVSMLATIRGNRYMFTAKDGFSRCCRAYPIPNMDTHTVAKVLMNQHFNLYRLPDQLHTNDGKEFLNNLWRVSVLWVQDTTHYNFAVQSFFKSGRKI